MNLTLNILSKILPNLISCEKYKKEIFENCEQILKNKWSVQFIIQKFSELEKLKKIIMKNDVEIKELDDRVKLNYPEELNKIINIKHVIKDW